MVGMPGLLTRFLARFLTRVFGQGFGNRKCSAQYYWDEEKHCTVLLGRRNTVFQFYRDGEKINILNKSDVFQNPMYTQIAK